MSDTRNKRWQRFNVVLPEVELTDADRARIDSEVERIIAMNKEMAVAARLKENITLENQREYFDEIGAMIDERIEYLEHQLFLESVRPI